MSRVGKEPIKIEKDVKINLDGLHLVVQGPKGKLERDLHQDIKLEINDKEIIVTRSDNSPNQRSLHGLTRALVNNMIVGVTKGYEKKLEIVGVGYRAEKKGPGVMFQIGYSHPVLYFSPEDVEINMENQTTMVVSGIDKQKVGQTAAEIRAIKPPEPYKGKGIKYSDERIIRKAGKAGLK